MKILSLSTLFPNTQQPRHGIFLRHRLRHLGRLDGIDLRVVAPVPWFPCGAAAFGRYAMYARVPRESEQQGLTVLHPRYPVLPKAGMTIAPMLMAAALLPRLLAMRRTGFDFDLIDSYYLYPDGVAAALLGMWLDRPVLMTAFGTDVSLVPTYAVPRRQILWAIRRSAGVTAVCQALKDKLVEIGAASGKVEVVLHGVDQDLFALPADRLALRRTLGFDRPTLISVGNLIRLKGHDIVIEALADLPGMDLVIVGDGPEEAALRHLAGRLKLTGRVRLLGHVDQARLPALLGAADALVLCSEREGIANVLIEALACGTPVVASAVGGSPEVVNVPEAGLLLADRSAAAVASAVRRLLSSPPDREQTRLYAQHFNWPETAARHARMIRQAVESAAAKRSAAPPGPAP